MWVNKDGQVFTLHTEIRRSLPGVSLPSVLTDEVIAAAGFKVLEVDPDPVPAVDEVITEELALVDGKWKKVKGTRPATPEELESKTAAEAERVNKLVADIIEATNWTQLLDTDGKVQKDYAAYRALLRAVPAQQGFPFSIDWPVKP